MRIQSFGQPDHHFPSYAPGMRHAPGPEWEPASPWCWLLPWQRQPGGEWKKDQVMCIDVCCIWYTLGDAIYIYIHIHIYPYVYLYIYISHKLTHLWSACELGCAPKVWKEGSWSHKKRGVQVSRFFREFHDLQNPSIQWFHILYSQIEIENWWKWSCNDQLFSNIVKFEKVFLGKGCFCKKAY
jgi:hypothetical protein